MPFTPLVLRPIGRASASLKRIAMPLAVARTISSPVLVIAHVDQLIVFLELDGDDAALERPAVGLQLGLFHEALARGHHQVVVGLVEVADGAAVGDLFVLGQVQQIHDRPAFALARELRQVVDLLPVDLALGREEQQVVVRAGDEQVLDRIVFVGLRRL